MTPENAKFDVSDYLDSYAGVANREKMTCKSPNA